MSPSRVLELLVLVPSVTLFLVWLRLARTRGSNILKDRAILVPMLVITGSCSLFLLGLANQQFIGPDYSTRRIVTIYLNLALCILMAAVPFFRRLAFAGGLLIASAIVALVWFYLAVISAVV